MSKLFGRTREMDLCTGPILKKILIFSLPIMLTNMLQLLFNAADTIVVGRFSAEGSDALAAVGTTGALIALVTNMVIGLSMGANVIVARNYGAKEYEKMSDAVHTSVLLGVVSGVITSIVGYCLIPTLLRFISVPEEIIPLSAQYMRIYFAGFVFVALYNFGSDILRAVGDTQRPLIFMALSGVLNVILNLIFVVVFHLGVRGVALATVISQGMAAFLVLFSLIKTDSVCKLELKKLRFHGKLLGQMMAIGLPSGIQASCFDLSNSVMQGSINTLGKNVMAGSAAACSIECILYTGMGGVGSASLSFTRQNMGAKNLSMIKKVLVRCLFLNAIIGAVVIAIAFLLEEPMLSVYGITDPEAMSAGIIRLHYVSGTMSLCTLMVMLPGTLRGMGRSIEPTVLTILGSCVLRIVWVKTAFVKNPTLETVFLAYPISWIVTAVMLFAVLFYWFDKTEKEFSEEKA